MTSSSTDTTTLPTTRWSDLHDAIRKCIPPLTSSSYKGSSGRVGVLGGSARYTGAPYYAAMASLNVGADLAFVFCAKEAAIPIKTYSPELMVAPVYDTVEFDAALAMEGDEGETERCRLIERMVSEVTALFDKLHVLVVGPGLGRHPMVLNATATILSKARDQNVPLVLDADALFLLTQDPHKELLRGYDNVVLTPNVVEYDRLVRAMDDRQGAAAAAASSSTEENSVNNFEMTMRGAIILQKGRRDILSTTILSNHRDSPKKQIMVCDEEGGLKRSGGIGDVLAGTVGTFVAWNRIMGNHHDDLLLASWSACCVTKRATKKAFTKKKRAMTAPDVLEEIGGVMEEMAPIQDCSLEEEETGDGCREEE